VFAATVKLTLPFPDPLAPDVIVMKLAELVAVHVHPVPAVTGIVVLPPAAGTVAVNCPIVIVQADGCAGVLLLEHATASTAAVPASIEHNANRATR
jgi:hypothetical protein